MAVAQARVRASRFSKMGSYLKFFVFFSYVFGFIALIAVLIDDKKNLLFSFHIWQAFLLNIFLAIIEAVYFVLYIPQKILAIEVASRASFFLKSLSIPLTLSIIILLILAMIAYKEKYFKIPLIGDLANKISKHEVK